MLDVMEGTIEPDYVQTAAANLKLASLQTIRWALDAQRTPIQDMRVNHSGADIRMA
jgi:hypothetical protein